jgi:hypothetical protein
LNSTCLKCFESGLTRATGTVSPGPTGQPHPPSLASTCRLAPPTANPRVAAGPLLAARRTAVTGLEPPSPSAPGASSQAPPLHLAHCGTLPLKCAGHRRPLLFPLPSCHRLEPLLPPRPHPSSTVPQGAAQTAADRRSPFHRPNVADYTRSAPSSLRHRHGESPPPRSCSSCSPHSGDT